MNKNTKRESNMLLTFFLVAFFILSFSFMQTSHASATTSTITLSVIDKLSLNVTSLNSEGVFATSDLDTNNISVTTNNGTGYMLGIKASTEGGNALVNSTDSSKTIPSHTISAGVSKTNYNDPTYASTNNLNNTWGFRPSTYYDTTNNVTIDNTTSNLYFPGPSSATNQFIIDKTTSANTTANEYNIALGTRVNSSTAPGKYTDTFIITAVANPTIYSITYNQNTTDTVTNMPQNAINQETYSDSVNISNLVPARDGFNFKGWCTVQVADGGTCAGTTYNPDGGGTDLTWTLDQTQSSNSLTLYAMWSVSSINLYDAVASMSKGPQTVAQLRTAITVPTSADRTEDTSNSGVYEYNASVFGTSSDASNTSKIYYYRGVLENQVGSYGSDGSAVTYPNYVKLGNTCWRIVRTTGSGGVKMIYNGTYGATTSGSCANSTTKAQVTTSAFNGTSSENHQIVRVGYTHNPTYATNTSKSGTIAQIFDFNSNFNKRANDTRSTIKEYIEDTWYANNMTSYTSKLEASAGYCNDRTMNTTTSWTTPLAESTTIASTYGTSGLQTYYFGAYPRNANAAQSPSLTCGNKYSQIDRSAVDLYRYVAGSTGVSNELKYPVALLTADEAAFAGSGWNSSTTPYHANSFLRSGSVFWLLSPGDRSSNGTASGFSLNSYGDLGEYYVYSANGVRPAISLKPGSMAMSGSGTATDPWIVDTSVNSNPYCTDASTCMQNTTNPPACGTTMTDGRDGATYTTATIAGTCWMTQNLRFTGGELKVGESDVTSDITMTYGSFSGDSYTEPRVLIGSTTDYGTYYNYCAASAGEVCNNTTQQDATRSVCPVGWKLPTDAQLNALPQKESHFTAKSGLAGYCIGMLSYVGSVGYWWSSTANSATHQYYLYYFSGDDHWGATYAYKYYGYSVRCVRAS